MEIRVEPREQKEAEKVAEELEYLFGDSAKITLVRKRVKLQSRFQTNWDDGIYRRFRFDYLKGLSKRMRAEDSESRMIVYRGPDFLIVTLSSPYADVLAKYGLEIKELVSKCKKEQADLVKLRKEAGASTLYR
jgi:hypothetical protein